MFVDSCHCPGWGKNWEELEESTQENCCQRSPWAAGHQWSETWWCYKSKWHMGFCFGFYTYIYAVAMNNTTNCDWFSGKARPELHSQSNSVWADEMYQESGGESHHWPSFQRDCCNVSGTCSQVSSTNCVIGNRSRLPMIILAVWNFPVDLFQQSSLPLRHFVSQ